MSQNDFKAFSAEKIAEIISAYGFPKYRAQQICSWLDKGVSSFDDMHNIPKELISLLSEKYYISSVEILEKYCSKIDNTVKYVYRLPDGETIEGVVMQHRYGWSQCISTQVGCKMGCNFCATGMDGFTRDLTCEEMISQIEVAENDLDIRISSLVLMGMGEPLDNFENVMLFLEKLQKTGGVHIGMRHVTLSTCGLVDKIRELMEFKLGITLSVSLHAPNDSVRRKMMPIAHRYSVAETVGACKEYSVVTGRRVSYEYAMIDGVNDSAEQARELVGLLKNSLCHVNLIPINSVEGSKYLSSRKNTTEKFMKILIDNKINATIRRTLGSDINASCGQLKKRTI